MKWDSIIKKFLIGTVGVAVQGNSGIFFDGIETKAVDKHEKIKESRIWDQCLVATEQHRKKFCRSIYGGFSVTKLFKIIIFLLFYLFTYLLKIIPMV